MGNDTYVNRHEAARIASVHLRTIDTWLADGILTRYKIGAGRTVRIKRTELEQLLTPTPASDG